MTAGKENQNDRRKYYHGNSLSTTDHLRTTLQLELSLCEEKPGLDAKM
jgi:hypothetical protein